MEPNRLLSTYWIKASKVAAHGFGVTAFSRVDAFQLLHAVGYFVSPDDTDVQVIEGIRITDLDQNHVVPNMGPIVVRGVWFPCRNL